MDSAERALMETDLSKLGWPACETVLKSLTCCNAVPCHMTDFKAVTS